MSLPGFHAEAALDHARERYSGGASRTDQGGKQVIIPQRKKTHDVHCVCDAQTDICKCDNGRVLHMVLGELS